MDLKKVHIQTSTGVSGAASGNSPAIIVAIIGFEAFE